MRECECACACACVCACSSICVCMAIPRGKGPKWEAVGSSRISEFLIPKANPSPGRLIPYLGGANLPAPLDSAHVLASGHFLPLWPQFANCPIRSIWRRCCQPSSWLSGRFGEGALWACAGLPPTAQSGWTPREAHAGQRWRTRRPAPPPPSLTAGTPANNGRPSGGPQGQRLCFWL